MIPQDFEFSTPDTLEELIELLSDGEKKILAGGMSLIPLMKLRLATPEHLVELSRVPGLNKIKEQGGSITIGAAATHFQLESSPLLRSRCPLLAETATQIGDVQVRNVGTIGGSVAHADPAADYPAALLALEAKVHVVGKNSDRTLPIDEFLVDTFTTALEPGEMILDTTVPVEDPSTGVHYEKVAHPASGFALVGIAARVRKMDGKIAMARVGVTGLSPRAFRARNVEEALEGTGGSAEDIRKAAGLVGEGVEANSDLAASAGYRKHLAAVHTARALTAALRKAA